ncbi:MAG TPA: type I restriction-modification enzyme R subunit C-terminal domain-containing protein, partial [Rhodothermia bacterium]|nr:type I restriction-modification enzyme R subunit C-terminal domain-containing protein [Rhodothermia bacterium]
MNKKDLSERDICTKFITPAVVKAGWDIQSQIREEVFFTRGRIIVRGKLVTRGKAQRADYILYYKPNIPIALIEAKDNNYPVGGGMQQAIKYAATLDIPFVFSSNGDAFLFHDRTGQGAQTETEYVSNIHYFGKPVYSYSLKEGIRDGFLAPYKVVKVHLDVDIEGYRPRQGETDKYGYEIEYRVYNQKDFDRELVIDERTKRVAQKVTEFLNESGDRFQKTIVFCVDTEHAFLMRQALINENQDLVQQSDRYVMRITGDDAEGCAQVGNFIDPEAKYPVIVTTSRLLSTGVDTQTCRLIVLDREVNSMTEFKQIVGRGTRVHEDTKKYYFTLIDFRKATNHFADPEFDGEPVQIYEPGENDPVNPPDDVPPTSDEEEPIPPEPGADEEIIVDTAPPDITIPPRGGGGRRKYYIDGDPVTVVAERIEYLDEYGKLVTETLRDYSKKSLRKRFASLNDFLTQWNGAERKEAIIEELKNEGLLLDPLAEEVGKDLDPFDLICHVAFDQPPLTRRDRVENVRKRDVFTKYGTQVRAVLEALLKKYQDEGVTALDDHRILRVAPFDAMGTPVELLKQFGGRKGFEKAV